MQQKKGLEFVLMWIWWMRSLNVFRAQRWCVCKLHLRWCGSWFVKLFKFSLMKCSWFDWLVSFETTCLIEMRMGAAVQMIGVSILATMAHPLTGSCRWSCKVLWCDWLVIVSHLHLGYQVWTAPVEMNVCFTTRLYSETWDELPT